MTIIIIQLIIILLLLILSAIFSGSETALFSLSETQIEKIAKKNPEKAKKIRFLLESPRRLIITILLGNEFVNISLSTLSAGIIMALFGSEVPWINIVIVFPILLLLGELTPKSFAIRNNEKFASFVSTPLIIFSKAITPVRWFIRNISDLFVNIVVKKETRSDNILSEDVVKSIIDESEKEGIIDALEKEFIYKIFDFGDTLVRDIMTPRANIFALPYDMKLKDIIREIKRNHYSKVPIYKEDIDHILGIIFATDLIGLTDKEIENSTQTLRKLLHKPLFIPDTKKAEDLFQTLRKRKISIAIVLDEYGGVVGLVTMEDLLEEIFGEISDEFEKEDKKFEKIDNNVYRVHSTLSLEEFNRIMDTDIYNENVNTIGGFVFSLFGELPVVNSTVRYKNLVFTVEKISNNRIETIRVKKDQ
ncbi:MAG: HlyC/CorC family transporter [Candidatus Marinimicrobia bacterium]|nr:HlyC/CorC family transporter [Candidatus Neomarinimicrobiota bacterium]